MKYNLREDFFIKLYFNTDNGFYYAGINRAFLDFSRTLKIKDENRANLKQNAEKFILIQLTKATQTEFSNQTEFDNFHKISCKKLRESWNELSFGQAQKWINMTLKYWLLLGNKRIKGIEKNAKYFHIPIDSYVQKGMFPKIPLKPWSKINDFKEYMNYQLQHRKIESGNCPMIDEFIFFNNYKPK
ncbi:MAG: hypothetical protein ABI091_09265 [Ferruginibacter sp.]